MQIILNFGGERSLPTPPRASEFIMRHSGSRKPFPASHNPLTLAVLALFAGASTTAAAAADEQKYVEVDPIVVTATRTAQPLSQAEASINVIQAKDIEQTAPQTFTDALLDIPNVDVTDSSSVMFSRISIRGSDANQITYLIDGMRQDDTTLGGNQFIGIFVDPEIVKQVEVKRGGGSSLYGNGGIGGTISVTTKSAADFLIGTDKNYGLKAKTGYATETQTWEKSAYAFGRYDIWDVLIGINRRDGGEIKSSTGRRSHNDSDSDYTSIIAKITAMPTDELFFSLAYNRDEANDTWNDSDWGAQIYKNEQNRVTGNVEFNHGPLVNLRAAVQYVDSSYAADSGAANNKNEFDSIGGNLQNTFEFSAGGNHSLTIGGDFYRKTQSGTTLEGDTWVDATARPDAEATDSGIFLQDVYAFNEYFSVTPVVRWNHYERKSNTGFPTVSDSKVLNFPLFVTLRYLLC